MFFYLFFVELHQNGTQSATYVAMFYLLECVICVKVVQAEIAYDTFKSQDFSEWSSQVNFDRKYGQNIDIKRTSMWKQHEGGKDILEVLFIKYYNVLGCCKMYDCFW